LKPCWVCPTEHIISGYAHPSTTTGPYEIADGTYNDIMKSFAAYALAAAVLGVGALPTMGLADSASSSNKVPIPSFAAYVGTSTLVQSSDVMVQKITSFAPKYGEYSVPIFAVIDGGRVWTADVLESQILSTLVHLPGSTSIIDSGKTKILENTSSFDWKSALSTAAGVLWTVFFYMLVIIRFIIAKVAIFYATLGLIIAIGVWRLVVYLTD
jgi:hypothetical protein